MRFILFVALIFISSLTYSQMDTILLSNPSFEDTPRRGGKGILGMKSWYDCGIINFPQESPPDIHPGRFWKVDLVASQGETYLGLVVRDNETWESICQRLIPNNEDDAALLYDNCYRLSMSVARSEKYISGSRLETDINTAITYNYTTPAVVRIWGGTGHCDRQELLATSNPVTNSNWRTITLDFFPEEDYSFITIEA